MIKVFNILLISLIFTACGSSDGSSANNSISTPDHRLGTYSAEIDSGGTIVRSFNIIIEPDQAITGGVPENVHFAQIRDADNLFSRYRYMRQVSAGSPNNHYMEGYSETEAAHYIESIYDSLQDCLDNVSGSNEIYERILISTPKFTGGGFGTFLTACKLKD